METFKSRYMHRCEELGLQPSHTLLEKIRQRRPEDNDWSGREYPDTLNLSGCNLTLKGCDALCKALAEDVVFMRLILADAYLGDEGCIMIAGVLKTNSALEHLDLRGNNIRAEGAIALAQALKVNATLRSLQLEWNCVGIWEQGIRAIADALGVNQGLRELDLRNNKIGPQAAACLALGLKRNGSLRKLDLRWNNAGLIGGRAFVDTLRWNTTVVQVDLTGNEIPDDILATIAVALERNKDRHSHITHTRAHTEQLTTTLQQLAAQHDETVRQLSARLATNDDHSSQLSQKLNDALAEIERSRALDRALEARLEEVRRQKSEVEDTLVCERGETSAKISSLLKELGMEREARAEAIEAHKLQMEGATQRALAAEAQARDAELKLEILKRDKSILLEELERAKQREKAALASADDKVQSVEASLNRKFKAQLLAKDDEFHELRRKLEDKLRMQEQARERLDGELETYRQRVLQHKLQMEECTLELEAKWRKDEESRRNDLEKRLAQALQARDQLQAKLDEAQRSYLHTLSEREGSATKLRNAYEQSREEVSTLKAQVASAHRELTDLRARLENATRAEESLRAKIAACEAEEERDRRKRKEEAERAEREKLELEREVLRCRERVRALEEAAERHRLDEVERRKMLERAVLDYTRGGDAIATQTGGRGVRI